jgi:transcriptional regulator with XRE-family HTH domain
VPRRENPLEYTTTGELYRGSLIRVLRQQKGLSRHQVATLVGYDPDSLSKVETNGVNASEQLLTKIATLLEVPLEQLQDAPEHPRIVRKTAVKTAAKSQAASTQGAPSQQTSSAAGVGGGVLQQILMLLQQLTGTVGQLTAAVVQQQAQVAALLQQLSAASPSDVPKPDPQGKGDRDKSSVNQNLGKAPAVIVPEEQLAEGVRKVEESPGSQVLMNWNSNVQPTRTIDELDAWDEYWTTLYEQAGSLYVVMNGLQGMTLHTDHYKEVIKPIMEQDDSHNREKKFIYDALDRLERRRKALEKHVETFVYCHITPIAAFESYVQTGRSRIDDYGLVLGGRPAPPHQRAADIRHIIKLLKDPKYNKYHLALLTGDRSKRPIYDSLFWELKGQILILENLRTGERNIKNSDPMLVEWFAEIVDMLLRDEGTISDRGDVINTLERLAEEADRLTLALART